MGALNGRRMGQGLGQVVGIGVWCAGDGHSLADTGALPASGDFWRAYPSGRAAQEEAQE